MIKLEFGLYKYNSIKRPIIPIFLSGRRVHLKCLIDTGADIPVFTKGLDYFLGLFPSAIYVKNAGISGFGGRSEYKVYNIPEFIFSDGLNSIKFINLHVAVGLIVSDNFDMILSSSLFDGSRIYFKFDKMTSIFQMRRKIIYTLWVEDKINGTLKLLYSLVIRMKIAQIQQRHIRSY